jgi:hypothetical protein
MRIMKRNARIAARCIASSRERLSKATEPDAAPVAACFLLQALPFNPPAVHANQQAPNEYRDIVSTTVVTAPLAMLVQALLPRKKTALK